jgi:hypothetical protein
MNKDTITGLLGEIYHCRNLRREWDKTINLGKAKAGQSFAIRGSWGETHCLVASERADRLKFGASRNIHLKLQTDPHVVTELVKFTHGMPSLVRSVQYGDRLSLKLASGNYGLSFLVEGDRMTYNVSASFT